MVEAKNLSWVNMIKPYLRYDIQGGTQSNLIHRNGTIGSVTYHHEIMMSLSANFDSQIVSYKIHHEMNIYPYFILWWKISPALYHWIQYLGI